MPWEPKKYAHQTDIPYGIIIGFNRVEDDWQNEKYFDDLPTPFDEFDGQWVLDDDVLEGHHPARLDALSRWVEIMNKADHVLVTYHNGHADDGCEYNGHHWHILADLRVHPTTNARWGKDIIKLGQGTHAVYIKCQVAISPTGLAKHILTKPRIKQVAKGRYVDMAESLLEVLAEQEAKRGVVNSQEPDWQGARLKEDHHYERMTNLMKLMKKYRTPDLSILKKRIKEVSPDDWKTYLQLMSLSSWDNLCKKAIELYKTEDKIMTFEKRFSTRVADVDDWETSTHWSVSRSKEILEQWCTHQGIDLQEFVEKFKAVLNREVPKKNTLALIGEASGGKSYVVRSVLPFYSYWGECNGGEAKSSNFIWQPMLDASIGIMEECYITQAMVDQAKLVLEGQQTMVNVKGKPHAILQPLPIIITANQDPWQYCSSAKQPLMDRMYYFRIRRMPELEEIGKKKLNPNMWYDIFNDKLNFEKGLEQGQQLCQKIDAEQQNYKTMLTNEKLVEKMVDKLKDKTEVEVQIWLDENKSNRGPAWRAYSRKLVELRAQKLSEQAQLLPCPMGSIEMVTPEVMNPWDEDEELFDKDTYEEIMTQKAQEVLMVPDTPPAKRSKLSLKK